MENNGDQGQNLKGSAGHNLKAFNGSSHGAQKDLEFNYMF